MTERDLCSLCRHENPPENRFCGWCGARLTSTAPAPRTKGSLAAGVGALPVRLKPVGKALAVGAAVLAAEAGLAWVRRRTPRGDLASLPAVRDADLAVSERLVYQSLEEVLVQTWAGNSQSRVFARRAIRLFTNAEPTDKQE